MIADLHEGLARVPRRPNLILDNESVRARVSDLVFFKVSTIGIIEGKWQYRP